MLLSAFLGTFGVDRFYRGQVGLGIVKLLTWRLRDLGAGRSPHLSLERDLPKDNDGAVIIDQKTLQLLRSGVNLVDQYGAPLK